MSTSQKPDETKEIVTENVKNERKASTKNNGKRKGSRGKRNRSASHTGLTPEEKRSAMPRSVTIEAKITPTSGGNIMAMEGTEPPPAKDLKLSRTELRIFKKGTDGRKAALSKTEWRKIKDQLNLIYAEMEEDNGMLDGLVKHVFNGSDRREPLAYGVFVYEKEEQAERMAELFPLLKLDFSIIMEIPGKETSGQTKPLIEMPVYTNKNVDQAKFFKKIRQQNKLQGKFLNCSYREKDERSARIYTLEPCPLMVKDMQNRQLVELAFGLDVYKIYTKNFG